MRVVFPALEYGSHFLVHDLVEAVELGRAVQHQHADGAFLMAFDMLIFHYFPRYCGARFSRKALMPSFLSSVPASQTKACRSWRKP